MLISLSIPTRFPVASGQNILVVISFLPFQGRKVFKRKRRIRRIKTCDLIENLIGRVFTHNLRINSKSTIP